MPKCEGPVPDKIVYAADRLRPNHRNPEDTYGRPALADAHPNMMVGDFGSPAGWPSQSPSRATFTPGMPGEGAPAKGAKTDAAAIQPGIRRP